MKFGNRVLHNRFILSRSILTLLWAFYVSLRLVDFGGAIPNTNDTFILYNTVNSGLVWGFTVIGLLGLFAGMSAHYMPRLKAFVLIAMLSLWMMLFVFFCWKDVAHLGFPSFSTCLIGYIAFSILIELWVGEAV